MFNILFNYKNNYNLFFSKKKLEKFKFFYKFNRSNKNNINFHSSIKYNFQSSLCRVIYQNGIELIKKGNSYVAICPFHLEKTPSFYVNEEKNIYHCFGCGKSGNLQSFIKELEKKKKLNKSFNYSTLLDNNNINFNKFQKKLYKRNEQTYLFGYSNLILIQIASNYYEKLVDIDKVAKTYLYTRGVSPLTAKIYKLGYSIITKQSLFKFFCNFYVNQEKSLESGLITKKAGIFYDMFQDRIIIPIFDQKGIIIGFGGRLVINKKFPKYLNSVESPIFKKNRSIYSEFNFKCINMSKPKMGILVEGYMDSIILVQNGIRFSLASMGTATSKYHLQRALILSQNKHILLCFDQDISGQNAAKKSFLNLSEKIKNKEFKISISLFSTYKDPDDFCYFKGGFDFTEHIINKTEPGIIWIEKFSYYFDKDVTCFLNNIICEIVTLLVQIFNKDSMVKYINIFTKILLREKQQSKISIKYLLNKYILQIKNSDEEMIKNIEKIKILKLLNNKKIIKLFEPKKVIESQFINEKKIFFCSFFLGRIGDDIFHNNFCSFFYFYDYSKYIYEKRRNIRFLKCDCSTFEYYWEDIYLFSKFRQILIENTDEYFMKIFNINKINLKKIKISFELLDNLNKDNTLELLIKKKNATMRILGKFEFFEKKSKNLIECVRKNDRFDYRKRIQIFKNYLEKKKLVTENTSLHILHNEKFKNTHI